VQLWAIHHKLDPLPAPLAPGRVSVDVDPTLPVGYYEAAGYLVFGGRAIRADMLERLAGALRQRARKGPVPWSPELQALVGLPREAFEDVLVGIGFRRLDTETGAAFVPAPQRPRAARRAPAQRPPRRNEHSPFAALHVFKVRQGE
jgi:ATP-dependent RNA helicase SUPV3L1/SUV3